MIDRVEYPAEGVPVIEVGSPTGPGSQFHAGKTQLQVGRRYGDRQESSTIFLLERQEAEELFSKLGDRLYGEGWVLYWP